MKLRSFVYVFTICCLYLLPAQVEAKPLTLADICDPYKEEHIENNRRIRVLKYVPEISEELRHIKWNLKHSAPVGHPRNKDTVVLWHIAHGVTVNDDFHVENLFFSIHPNDIALALRKKLIESNKAPNEQRQAVIDMANKQFVSTYKEKLTGYCRHMGYPTKTIDELDQFLSISTIQKNGTLQFGGKTFKAHDHLTIQHFTPKPNAPSNKPFIALIHKESVRSVTNGFTSIAVLSCEFISENGVSLSKKIIGSTKPIDQRNKSGLKKPAYKLRNLGLKVYPKNHIGHYVRMVFIPSEYKSQVCLANWNSDRNNPAGTGDLVQTIDGIPARTEADLNKIFSRPVEQLGKKVQITVLSSYNERKQAPRGYMALRSFEETPDSSEMERQRRLIAEHAKIEEDARQEVITMHEKRRLLNRLKALEEEKKKNLEVLKTREGLMQLVRKHAQPNILKFIEELKAEDPLWALSYLKYLADTQPDILSPKQRGKLKNLGWLAQDTPLYSWSFIKTSNPESIKQSKKLGIKLTRWNTSQTQLTMLKDEMVYLHGIFFLPIDHPEALLNYLLNDKRSSLGQLEPFTISNCGLCSVGYNIQHLLHDPKLKNLKVVFSKPKLADYQAIVAGETRNYGSFDPPKPKRRTLIELAAKGWIITTITANTLIAGAEAVGIDTSEVLNQARRASLEPKTTDIREVHVRKLIEQRNVKSTFTGARKGVRHEYKLDDGRRITLIKVDKDNGSLTWGGHGWHLDYFSAQKLKLSSQKKFKTKEELIRYVENEGK